MTKLFRSHGVTRTSHSCPNVISCTKTGQINIDQNNEPWDGQPGARTGWQRPTLGSRAELRTRLVLWTAKIMMASAAAAK